MIRRRDDAHAFQEAWENGAPAQGEVAELVQAAERLCESAVAEPSADFRLALREQLMAEAEDVLVARPAVRPAATTSSTSRRTRRRLAAATAACVASFGAISLVASSATAMPGDVLYPVKLGVENVQLSFKDDGADRGTYQLDRATERLREAEAVAGDADQHGRLPGLLADFTSQAEDGSNTLFGSFTTDGDEASIETVNDFVTRSTTVLAAIAETDLPADVDAAWDDAAKAVSALALESSRLCGSCDKADVDDLLRSVASGADAQRVRPVEPPSSEPSSAPRRSRTVTASPVEPATSPTSAAPTRKTSPTPSTSSGLRGITDPVVGGLLGDDDTVGLVPGLLDGLLGGGSSK
ncbi:DUF5667 domain-containing protein [Aeromicrobium sp. CTD01-1L150]|uniref:DUF5667 domain-containing protein n=1 Tax=Aeromicrobium sp. CTD01-1L150 TaxID=3341830 RepID=UPI0035C15ABC